MKANEEKSAKLYSLFIAKDSRLKELAKEASVLLSSEEDLAILRTIYKAQFTNALQNYNADEFIESVSLLGFDECKNEMWAFINDKISSEKSKCVKFLDALPKETIEEYFTTDDYHPNAGVRQYLARKTQSVSWLKHPCVISEWNASLARNESLSSLFIEIKNIGESVINDFSQYIAECPISSDKLKWNTFLEYGNIDCYYKIENKQTCVKTLEDFQPLFVKNFLKKIADVMDNESEEFLELISWIEEDTIAKGIKEMSSDEQYQFLQCIPDQLGLDVVYKHFKDKPIFKTYIGEKWDICKAEVPYVVFDMETDSDTITEFSFLKEDNVRTFEDEEQLRSLGRAITMTPIVVGHNIKQ